MKPLARQKLDVVHQTRSNLFGWRGQFTPEFKPVEFERFGNYGEFAAIRVTQPLRWVVSIPWNSTGLEVRAVAGFTRLNA